MTYSGEPKVDCAAKSISVDFNTEAEFEGHVFVKGFYENKGCRTDASFKKNTRIEVPISSCDIRRQRQVQFMFLQYCNVCNLCYVLIHSHGNPSH